MRKPNFGVSDTGQPKLTCLVTEEGLNVEILALRNIVLSLKHNKDADQLCSNCTDDLHLCFRSIGNKQVFQIRLQSYKVGNEVLIEDGIAAKCLKICLIACQNTGVHF